MTIFNERLDREKAPEQVLNRLREAIITGQLRPGFRMPQAELAESLGVSRMPIREALNKLEAEGLVVIHPYRGAEVAELSAEELSEIYEIRIALETLALSLGVPQLDASSLEKLRNVLQKMDHEEDSSAWLALNTEFHTLLYQSSSRALLIAHIENLRNKSDRYLRLFAAQRNRTEQAQREHWDIFTACERGDAKKAHTLLAKHLQSTIKSLSKTLALQPLDADTKKES